MHSFMIIVLQAQDRQTAKNRADEFFDQELGYEEMAELENEIITEYGDGTEECDRQLQELHDSRRYPAIYDWYQLGGRWDDSFNTYKLFMLYGRKLLNDYVKYLENERKQLFKYISSQHLSKINLPENYNLDDIRNEVNEARIEAIKLFFKNDKSIRLPYIDRLTTSEDERNCVPLYDALPMIECYLYNEMVRPSINQTLISMARDRNPRFINIKRPKVTNQFSDDLIFWNIDAESTYLPLGEDEHENYWAVMFDYHY